MTKYHLPDADVTLFDDFFSKEESDHLFAILQEKVAWRQDKIKMFGKVLDQPRLTAWYGDPGCDYTYSGITMKALPWIEELELIKERVEDAADVLFNSCLLNLYRNGKDSMGWHQDNEKELGKNPSIASVSFGTTRPFQLKHKTLNLGKTDILLTHGSMLLMQGSTQHHWKHQIPKTARPIEPRINLTFRMIKHPA